MGSYKFMANMESKIIGLQNEKIARTTKPLTFNDMINLGVRRLDFKQKLKPKKAPKTTRALFLNKRLNKDKIDVKDSPLKIDLTMVVDQK